MNYQEIREALDSAQDKKSKIAMFHYITLKYAHDFIHEDPKYFCNAVGMKESYATEFRKMRALHLLMKDNNFSL
ncbi:MAG: hypothetical protein WC043_03590 [Pseudobdellovibrionaceae bacterium]